MPSSIKGIPLKRIFELIAIASVFMLTIGYIAYDATSTAFLAREISALDRHARIQVLDLAKQADPDLKRSLHRYESQNSFYYLQRNIDGVKQTLYSRSLPKPFLQKIQSLASSQQSADKKNGFLNINNQKYIWASASLPGDAYKLVLIERSTLELGTVFLVLGVLGLLMIIIIIGIVFSIIKRQYSIRDDELFAQSLRDPLTGLANRTLLYDRLQQTIASAKRNKKSIALLLIDIDRFKEINNTLGHEYGDIILKQIEPRLRKVVRETDTIARFGGDEFAIVLSIAHTGSVTRCLDKIMNLFHLPFYIEEIKLSMGIEVSIGVALYPNHGDDPETLIMRAEMAMYKAKKQGSQICFYTPKDDPYSLRRLALISDLRKAIEDNELSLHYQPKVDLENHCITSVEALLRWNHQRHNIIPPMEFIPLAEQSGVIKPLTQWVLKTAIHQYQKWNEQGIHLNIAVNLSARNLHDQHIVQDILNMLEESEMDPSHLELEITESAMMVEPDQAKAILQSLDQLGIKLSIDDFGTGYSSLAYLKDLPVDNLKIDKTFVMGMMYEKSNDIIVNSTIKLAHGLGYQVIAEGVEDKETLEKLTTLGCNAAQGYHICRPLPADELGAWFKTTSWSLAGVA
ncbi:MAG: hypothetical protein BMS9Abin11_0094 [Gammaproteobacteria bacterium]|nr:MAG: hypothetical protein BMS9Abin11_0094 [Gammaproteobacteria bacterium]